MSQIGPELTKKRVAALLITAALILFLFSAKVWNEKRKCLPPGDVPELPGLIISPFDSLFKACSDSLFDWKMLAAIAYVESRFDTAQVSDRGAFGLMQVMPATYSQNLLSLGISNTDSISTELNVLAAVRQLHDGDAYFNFINPEERINFILGAYNCGQGHIFDAMRIARSKGINRYLWANIADVMATMSDSAVYSDTVVCHFGSFNYSETVRFVRDVRAKYQEYCNLDTIAIQ